MKLPQPIHYTETEGGDWIKWVDRRGHTLANCIVFDNGRAFDVINGWRDARKFKYDRKTGERL